MCRCHSDDSIYGRLADCPACKHRSYDPGVGCERRKCGYVEREPANVTQYAYSVHVNPELLTLFGDS